MPKNHSLMLIRPRRNRKSVAIRNLVQETQLSLHDFIYPMFITEGINKKIEIKSMPNIFRFSLDNLLLEIAECVSLGIQAIALFPHYEENKKDKLASESWNENTFYLHAISKIKLQFPTLIVMSDVAMDPYSSDGHDGFVQDGKILNDETLEILARMAVAQARAGADIVGPSDMMDERIAYIRQELDNEGFTDTSIMSYSVKYASAFYGPFRDALDSAPKMGDKNTYQMNPANSREALLEAQLDVQEGADFLMVKPAGAYLDIIKILHDNTTLPIAAYQVSGEYAMLKAASQNGWIDYEKCMVESLISIKRAGASIILSYCAKDFAKTLAQ